MTFSRKWIAARTAGLHDDPVDSCRIICTKYMCGNSDPCSAAKWNEDCCTGKCANCPDVSFPVPSGQESSPVTLSIWTQKEISGRKKYGLFRVSMSLLELSNDLRASIPKLKDHVRTAAVSWAKVNDDLAQLRPGTVLTFEDYQRNFEVFHSEMPTSMGFSANNIQLALYPIGVKFMREEGGEVETGAVVFISPDLKHDHQQIEVMANW